jgi:hypothetical protein
MIANVFLRLLEVCIFRLHQCKFIVPKHGSLEGSFDATGEIDYGHFDSFVEVASGQFEVSGDFWCFPIGVRSTDGGHPY